METIVPAFILALLSQASDRPALLTAILSDRYGRSLTVALAAGVAHAAGNAIAMLGGAAMAPLLNPHAQALLLAVALVLGGVGGILPAKLPSRLERLRMGPFFTPALGIFALAAGERTQFFTLAIAARGSPELAAVGSALGAFTVAALAATMGERGWRKLPTGWIRIVSALLMTAIGVYVGLGALRLR